MLCPNCHSATSTYDVPGKTSPKFSPMAKEIALAKAANQCECTSDRGCH